MGNDAGVEGPRRAFGDPPVEDQADLLGSSQVEVLADHRLKEMAPGQGPVEHLGAGELRLQDGELEVVAGRVVRRREGVREPSQPLGHHRRDPLRAQVIEDLLRAGGIGAGEQPVVQGLEGNALFGQLPLDVLMAVETDPRGVGEVGAELDEQGTEVLIDQVEVVVVAHHRPAGEPGVRLTGVGAALLDHAEAGKALLGGADVQDALRAGEVLQPFPGDLVFALPLAEGNDIDPFALGKGMDRLDEVPTDRGHQHRRGDLGPAMGLEEGRHPAAGLQPWLIQVEIQPVDPFEIQGDMVLEQLSDGLVYHDCRPRLTSWPRATRRYARLYREHSLPSLNRGRPTPQSTPHASSV